MDIHLPPLSIKTKLILNTCIVNYKLSKKANMNHTTDHQN